LELEDNMKALTIGGAAFLLLCAGGTRVEAQGVASSFDQLGVLVKPGDKISVVDVTGREAEGHVWKLWRDRLTLVTTAGPRQFGDFEVATIRQRRGDSLTNGAIIGAVAGTAYFLTGVALLRTATEAT
jgi:threonine dehydrogenase-like Zn-dependent dehydrogenase